jgi:hypothetical protein
MLEQVPNFLSVISEKDLRRQIDRSVSRALVDGDYARLLLTDPTVVLEDRGCPPQHYLSLRSIQAHSLLDFARQARALFWAIESSASNLQSSLGLIAHRFEEEPYQLAAGAVSLTG